MTRKPPRPTRIKAGVSLAAVPQNRDQAAQAVAEIGVAERELQRRQAAMNEALASIKEDYETRAEPHRQQIAQRTRAVQTWAEAHRDELTQHGKVKTCALPSGELLWRTRPPSVRISGAEAVLDLLRRRGLGRFIRTREEINREAILVEPQAVAGVPGIAISQAEDFVIVPFEVALTGAAVPAPHP